MREEIKERIAMIKRGEVPEGYKKTKMGIVPEDWECLKIKDCIERIGKPVEVQENEEYVQIGIRSHGKGLFYKEPVTGKELGKKNVYWIEPNCFILNIVFAWEQAVGKTTEEERGLICSHRFPMYRSVDDKVLIDYLVYFFLTDKGKEIMEKASPGGAGRNRTLGQERFLKSFIVVPPMQEQIKISKMLSLVNCRIKLIDNLISEKFEQKEWLIQNLFTGKRRINGFNKEWRSLKLEEVLEEVKEKNVEMKKQVYSVSVKKGIVNQEEHLGRSYAAKDTSNYNVVSYGDLVYTKSPTGEFPYGIIKQSMETKKVAVSPLYGVFRPVNIELGYIIHSFFQSKSNVYNYLHPIVQKGAKNTINVSNSTFLSRKLYLPTDIKEQQAIAQILFQADKEIELLKQKLEQLKLEKKAIMQLLLTGIVRVNH